MFNSIHTAAALSETPSTQESSRRTQPYRQHQEVWFVPYSFKAFRRTDHIMPTFWQELVGGTVGGAIGITAVYPLDTIKSRLQTSGKATYSGTIHVLTSMARTEGVQSLYRGLLFPVAGYGILFAIVFSSYGLAGRTMLRHREAGDGDRLMLWEMGLAGMFSGLANSPQRQVIERVKSVMQVRLGEKHKPPYSWSGACLMDLVRKEGVVMGLFRGHNSTLLRETVQFGIYYPTYATAKKFFIPEDPARRSKIPEPILQTIAGGLAGCASWMPPVYTLDVIKTRMQTAAPGTYSGIWDCTAKTWRAEGMGMFSRGLGPSLLRAFPLHGLIFLGYETTLLVLDGRFPLTGEKRRQN
ncbi:unnamed protein product [Ascophyllum nodosum]